MLMKVHTLTLDQRFKSPQVWKVIESYHGKKISRETDFRILQLRYADRDQQKMLKMETNMSPLQSYPPNQLLSSSQNTARNILRLLVISTFAAPSDTKVVKLEEEPEIVQILFYWKGVTLLIAILLSLLVLIVLVLLWWRAKDREKVDGLQ